MPRPAPPQPPPQSTPHLPTWEMVILLLGRTSIPFLYHLPVTFSSDTSHLNMACSEAFTVRSAMSCRTSSCFSGWGEGDTGPSKRQSADNYLQAPTLCPALLLDLGMQL